MWAVSQALRNAALSLRRKPQTRVTLRKTRLEFQVKAWTTPTRMGEDQLDTGGLEPVLHDVCYLNDGAILRVFSKAGAGVTNNSTTEGWYVNRVTDGTVVSQWEQAAALFADTDNNAQASYTRLGLYADPNLNDPRLFWVSRGGQIGWRQSASGGVTWSIPQMGNLPVPFSQGTGYTIAPVGPNEVFLAFRSQNRLRVYRGTLTEPSSWSWMAWSNDHYDDDYDDSSPMYLDAEILGIGGTKRVIVFPFRKRAFSCIYENGLWSEPVALLPIFEGDATLRVAGLSAVNETAGVLWAVGQYIRYNSEDYDPPLVVYLKSKDGVSWSLGEESFVGLTPCRGKLVPQGDYLYCVGHSVVYRATQTVQTGRDVTSLKRDITADVLEWSHRSPQKGAGELGLTLGDPGRDYHTEPLLTSGSELTVEAGFNDEYATVALASVDDPGQELADAKDSLRIVARDRLKKLVQHRIDLDYEYLSQSNYHNDFKRLAIIGKQGTWKIYEKRYLWADGSEMSPVDTCVAFAPGKAKSFQAQARLKVDDTSQSATLVFWGVDKDNLWAFGWSNGNWYLTEKRAGVSTNLQVVPGTLVAQTWYDLRVIARGGTVSCYWKIGSDVAWTALTVYHFDRAYEPSGHVGVAAYPVVAGKSVYFDYVSYADLSPVFCVEDVAKRIVTRSGLLETTFGQALQDSFDQPDAIVPQATLWAGTGSIANGELSVGLNSNVVSRARFSSLYWETVVRRDLNDTVVFLLRTNLEGTSGVRLELTSNSCFLYVGGVYIENRGIPYLASGTAFRYLLTDYDDWITLFANGQFLCAFYVPGGYGHVGFGEVGGYSAAYLETRVPELGRLMEAFIWAQGTPALGALGQVLEHTRTKYFCRRDGSLVFGFFDAQNTLSVYADELTQVGVRRSDREWASRALVVGAENYAEYVDPIALAWGNRFTKVDNPYLLSVEECRQEGRRILKELRSQAVLRDFEGLWDPQLEQEDRFMISGGATHLAPASGDFVVDSLEVSFRGGDEPSLEARVGAREYLTHPTPGQWNTDYWDQSRWG